MDSQALTAFDPQLGWDETVEIIKAWDGASGAGAYDRLQGLASDSERAKAAIHMVADAAAKAAPIGSAALGFWSYARWMVKSDPSAASGVEEALRRQVDWNEVAATLQLGYKLRGECAQIHRRLQARWKPDWFELLVKDGLTQATSPLAMGRKLLVEISKQACGNVLFYTFMGNCHDQIELRTNPVSRRRLKLRAPLSPWLTYGDVANLNRLRKCTAVLADPTPAPELARAGRLMIEEGTERPSKRARVTEDTGTDSDSETRGDRDGDSDSNHGSDSNRDSAGARALADMASTARGRSPPGQGVNEAAATPRVRTSRGQADDEVDGGGAGADGPAGDAAALSGRVRACTGRRRRDGLVRLRLNHLCQTCSTDNEWIDLTVVDE